MNEYLISSLEAQLKNDPNSRVFLRLAEELRKADRLDEAILTCRQGLETHPDYLPAEVCLARALYSKGELDEAEVIFRDVNTRNADNVHALRGLGDIAYESERFEEALRYYEMMALLDPSEDVLEKLERIKAHLSPGDEETSGSIRDEAEDAVEPEPSAPEADDSEVMLPAEPVQSEAKTVTQASQTPISDPEPEASSEPIFDEFSLEQDDDEAPMESLLGPVGEEAVEASDELEITQVLERPDVTFSIEPQEENSVSDMLAGSGVGEMDSLPLALLYERQGHLDDAKSMVKRLLAGEPGNATLIDELMRMEESTTETSAQKKIRILSRWLARIKESHHV